MKIYNLIVLGDNHDPDVESYASLAEAEFNARMKIVEYNKRYGGDYSVIEDNTNFAFYAYMDDVYEMMIVETEAIGFDSRYETDLDRD